jgi:hypothetical protein
VFGTFGFLTQDVTIPGRGIARRGFRVYILSTDARRLTTTIDIDGTVVTVASSYVR